MSFVYTTAQCKSTAVSSESVSAARESTDAAKNFHAHGFKRTLFPQVCDKIFFVTHYNF